MSRPNTKDRQEAIRLYVEEKSSLKELAKKLGFSFSWAQTTIKNAGVTRDKSTATRMALGKEDKMQLALSFVLNDDLPLAESARLAGVSDHGLRYRMKKSGLDVPTRSDGNRKKLLPSRESWVLRSFHARRAMRDLRDDGMSPERIAKAWRVRLEVAERILKEAS